MSITFRLTHRVEGEPERVFRALTDPDIAHSWMPGLVRIDRVGVESYGEETEPLRVGSRYRETRVIFRKEATEEFEVTELVPPTRLGLLVDGRKGSSRRGEYAFTYTLAPDGDGTHITLDAEIRKLNPVGKIVARLFAGSYRRACMKDLEALGAHLRRERRHGAKGARVS